MYGFLFEDTLATPGTRKPKDFQKAISIQTPKLPVVQRNCQTLENLSEQRHGMGPSEFCQFNKLTAVTQITLFFSSINLHTSFCGVGNLYYIQTTKARDNYHSLSLWHSA